MLPWAYYLLLLALSLLGLALAVLGLPGIWLIVAATALFAWLTGAYSLFWCVLALLLLAILAEIAESALGGIAAKKAGGSKRGMIGAIAGGLVGALAGTFIPIPIVGTLIGACAGAFIGAFSVELFWLKRNTRDSLAIGYASAKGRLYGMLVKLAFGGAMFLTAAIWTFPAWRSQAAAPVLTTVPAPATVPAITPSTVQTTVPTTAPAGGTAK